MIRQTSIDAFNSIKDKLSQKQRTVYELFLVNDTLTDVQIADKLGWKINSVTPRRNELENNFNIIFCIGTQKNEINRKVRVYALK